MTVVSGARRIPNEGNQPCSHRFNKECPTPLHVASGLVDFG